MTTIELGPSGTSGFPRIRLVFAFPARLGFISSISPEAELLIVLVRCVAVSEEDGGTGPLHIELAFCSSPTETTNNDNTHPQRISKASRYRDRGPTAPSGNVSARLSSFSGITPYPTS